MALRMVGLVCAATVVIACGTAREAHDGVSPSGEEGGSDVWPDAGTPGRDATNSPQADVRVADGVARTDVAPADARLLCTPQTYRLRHLQASMEHFDPAADLNVAIDIAFAAGAETISWTEIEKLAQVERIDGRSGWDTYWPSGKAEDVARNAVPVSWRTDAFKLIRGQSWLASEGLAGVSPSRWVTRVWLTHLASGQVLSRVAHHSVSGVDGDGKDPVAWRRAAHADDIAKFKEVMMLDTVPVIGSADFNTTRLPALLGTSFQYDVPANGGSHGARLIDWIVRRPHPDHTFIEAQFISLGPSDHRGVRASYDYRTQCRGA